MMALHSSCAAQRSAAVRVSQGSPFLFLATHLARTTPSTSASQYRNRIKRRALGGSRSSMLLRTLKDFFEPTPKPASVQNISNSGPDRRAENAGATGSGTGSRPSSNLGQVPNPASEPVHFPKEPVRVPKEPAQVPKNVVKPRPHALAQATAFLVWLRANPKYAGNGVYAWRVKRDLYPRYLVEKGWRSRPWDGRLGVGKFLKQLTGGRKVYAYVEDNEGQWHRLRVYPIPQHRGRHG
jgi:hypothetical protein